MSRWIRWSFLPLLSAWLAGTVPGQQPAQAPVPGPDQVANERTKVDRAFDVPATLAGGDPAAITQLAERLRQEATQGKNPPLAVYTLLAASADVAEHIGAVEGVVAALRELGQRFPVDEALLRYESALRMGVEGGRAAPHQLVHLFCDTGTAFVADHMSLAEKCLVEARRHFRRASSREQPAAAPRIAQLEAAIDARRKQLDRAPATAQREPVPAANDADRQRTRKELTRQNGDLSKRSKREMAALAQKALDEGMATARNPAGTRYERLLAAQSLAAAAGDADLLVQAATERARQFELDALELRLEAAQELVRARSALPPVTCGLLLEVARDAITQRPDLARTALTAAGVEHERARGSRDSYEELRGSIQEVTAALAHAETLTALRTAAESAPDDTAAREKFAWFLCVQCGDWATGLPLLAKGTTLQLMPGVLVQNIARLELGEKVTDQQALEIAGAWQDFAEWKQCPPAERPAIERHALTWWQRLADHEGYERERIQRYLQNKPPAAPAPAGQPAPAAPAPAPAPAAPKPRGSLPKSVDDSVQKAFTWLVQHQDADGRWDGDGFMKHDPEGDRCDGAGSAMYDVGVTGLAALALLAAGDCGPKGAHAGPVQRALDWLVTQQDEAGRIGAESSHSWIYGHAIATQALATAAQELGNARWGTAANRGGTYVLAHRNPHAVWRYHPRDNDNDMSVTAWCVAALHADRAHVPDATWQEVTQFTLTWLNQASDPSGLHGYTKQGEPSGRLSTAHMEAFPPDHTPMTAAGLHTRLLLGQRGDPVLQAAARLILDQWPTKTTQRVDYYGWYLASSALRSLGGSALSRWRPAVRDTLIGQQQKAGNAAGSWAPVDVWGCEHGRVGSTAFACLALIESFTEAAK